MTTINEIIIHSHQTPVGELIIGAFQDMICLCDWRFRKMRSEIDLKIQKELSAIYKEGDARIIQKCITELEEYFVGQRKTFDLPLYMVGTEFQKKVWITLQQIPYGEKKSYLDLSRMIGNEKAIRAVAAANGSNAISIIVPCHRIIGSKGELTGYAGGLNAKNALLKLEARGRKNEQLELF